MIGANGHAEMQLVGSIATSVEMKNRGIKQWTRPVFSWRARPIDELIASRDHL
jgi:hypothetical protein